MVKSVFIARKSDGMIFCEVSDECSNDKNLMSIRNKAIDYMKSLQSKEDLHSVNIGSQNFMFHYKINENIIYMAITDVKYSQKLAFCFLQDIHEGFMDVYIIAKFRN
jgi:vesicle transport protein SEC22